MLIDRLRTSNFILLHIHDGCRCLILEIIPSYLRQMTEKRISEKKHISYKVTLVLKETGGSRVRRVAIKSEDLFSIIFNIRRMFGCF